MNVAPSYVTDNGGKTGGKAGGDVPSLSQVWSPVGRSTVEEDGKKPPRDTCKKKHELFRKRAGIEPVIGHCKSDHRLGRNFYRGLFGDSINVMLAAAAYNLIRAIALFVPFQMGH